MPFERHSTFVGVAKECFKQTLADGVLYNSLLHAAFVFSLIITFNQLCTTQRFQGLFTNVKGFFKGEQKTTKTKVISRPVLED